MIKKPWDLRLAGRLVRPLIHTRITPNHLTTLRLLTGVAAAVMLSIGGIGWFLAGALLFDLSHFTDHTDGELARMSGKSSRWGHQYDYWSDAFIQVSLFLAFGYRLQNSFLGGWSLILGVTAALAIGFIFVVHAKGELMFGKEASDQPCFAGFEIEDVLYLMPLTIFQSISILLLIGGAIGAPIYGLYALLRYRSLEHARVVVHETGGVDLI